MDYEKIVESEGIPFTFIINLMKEIQEILDAHEQNLVYQVEKVLNKEFDALSWFTSSKLIWYFLFKNGPSYNFIYKDAVRLSK